MSRKRQNTSSEPDSPPSKRRSSANYDISSDSDEHDAGEQPQVDASTGQTGAFPGLDVNDDELFYGPASNGLEFLRMVRSEARGIPQLLTAATSNQPLEKHNVEPVQNYGGFFDDDAAFVAAPLASEEKETSFGRAQHLYHESLLIMFNLARATLKCILPLNQIQALDPSIPISFPSSSKPARKNWEAYIIQHAPHPVQIACMDTDSVLQVIRLITKKMAFFFRSHEQDDMRRIGTWIWSVLAKCPDRGHLGSEEISDLRAFAKRAHITRERLQRRAETVSGGGNDEPEDDSSEDDDVVVQPLQELQQRDTDQGNIRGEPSESQGDIRSHSSDDADASQASHKPEFPGPEVILDMVITVVGQIYGQRDLLESRQVW